MTPTPTPRPTPRSNSASSASPDSALARLARELSLCEGGELERALAESAPLLAQLAARPSLAGRSARARLDACVTFARAERELAQLVASEVARLCELAARASESGFDAAELAHLLGEELDCADDLRCLPAELGAAIRDLTWRLSFGESDGARFLEAAAIVRSHCVRP